MAVFDARQGQVLPQPVTNYYQGKALRAGIKAQELENEMAPAKLELAQQKAATDAHKANTARLKFERDVGLDAAKQYAQDLYSRIYAIDEAVTNGEVDETGALETAAESFAEYAMTLPEAYRAPIAQALEGGLTIDEYRQIKAGAAGALEDYDLLDQKSTSPLSLEEKVALGMPEDWAKNTVVERDQDGNLTINNRPTGLTPEDVNARSTSDSNFSKSIVEFQENTIGAVSGVKTGTEILKISFANPEALGSPGAIMRFGANLVEGTKSLMDFAGYDSVDVNDTAKQVLGADAFNYDKWDLDKLGVSGAEAEAFRAGVYGIAFATAVAEQGTRPTDKDIQQFIDQIGGRATSPKSFRRAIVQFMRRQDFRLKTIATVKGIPELERSDAFDAWTPAFNEFMEQYAKGEGIPTATMPDGTRIMLNRRGDGWETFAGESLE